MRDFSGQKSGYAHGPLVASATGQNHHDARDMDPCDDHDLGNGIGLIAAVSMAKLWESRLSS